MLYPSLSTLYKLKRESDKIHSVNTYDEGYNLDLKWNLGL